MGTVHRVFLVPNSVIASRDLDFIGHEFDLLIDCENVAECQLRWWERTNVPYVEHVVNKKMGYIEREGMISGQWTNMMELCRGSEVFRPWVNAQNANLRNRTVITIKDIPAVLKNKDISRRLDFRIIVEGTDGTERAVEARQQIDIANGIARSSFVIIINDAKTTASNFVLGEAPLRS